MDGNRRYTEEPGKPSWYSAQSAPSGQNEYATGPSPYDSGVYERPSGAFRLPDQRPAEAYAADPVTSTGSHARPTGEHPRVPVRGPEYPAVRPNGVSPLAEASARRNGDDPAPQSPRLAAPVSGYDEPTSLVPPVPVADRNRDVVYAARRPVSSVIIAFVTALLMVPVVRLVIAAAFADNPVAASIVPAVLLTLGLPLSGVGLYALARGGRPHNRDTWLRPPVAYLPTGLFLILAAAIAVA